MSKSIPCDRNAAGELLDDPIAAFGFRTDLRMARQACQRDSEAFDEILFSIERLGCFLRGKAIGLGEYKCCLCQLVSLSNICLDDVDFEALLRLITGARNDALHQGAVARHLASRSIEAALILEKALGSRLTKIEYLMVKQPVVAESWHTLAMIRQTMLANAFSYLPYEKDEKWFWISDYALAAHLQSSGGINKQKEELAKPLKVIVRTWAKAEDISKDDLLQHALALINEKAGTPLLVLDGKKEHLIGIVTAADLL